MLEIDKTAFDALPVEDALERMLTVCGTLNMNRETIAIFRLVLGESARFPEIAAAFAEVAIGRTRKAMQNWLQRLCDRGLIALEDLSAATGMLRGMMIMEPQRAAMLGEGGACSGASSLQNLPDTAFLNAASAMTYAFWRSTSGPLPNRLIFGGMDKTAARGHQSQVWSLLSEFEVRLRRWMPALRSCPRLLSEDIRLNIES